MKTFDDIELMGSERQTQVMSIFTQVNHAGEMPEIAGGESMDIAILPLRNMVLLPGVAAPVQVGREKSSRLIKEAVEGESLIGVVCQRDSRVEDPKAEDLHTMGTLATIIKVLELPDNTTTVIVQSRSAFVLNELTADEPYLRGRVTTVEQRLPEQGDNEFAALMNSIGEVTAKMSDMMGHNGEHLSFALKNIDEPVGLINYLATNLPFDPEDKQKMLEEPDVLRRAYLLYDNLSREEQFMQMKARIQSRAREDLSQQQREHYLQQQLKTIQEELGNDENDVEALTERAKSIEWDEGVRHHLDKELLKLRRTNPQSPDYAVQYNYLDHLLSLPWGKMSEDNFDLANVEAHLNADHYGLEKVKDRILEHLSVLKLRGDLKSPILCLYGPPGVGKTSLGRSIAESLGRRYARISLGGLHDEAEIRGHRRTYIGAMPGRIADAMIKCGTSNPVIVLDEIDKVGQDFKGDPSSALLEVLDPEQNGHFHDNYIDVDYDLSHVLFIATANSLTTISQPLLDRMEVIDIAGYVTEEKVEIAKRHLIAKQLEANGLEKDEIHFDDAAIVKIVESYSRESGVRELEKKIAKCLRKIARAKASGLPYPKTVSVESLKDYLGAEDYNRERYEDNRFAGVVTGLAWTALGGEILFVESSLWRGKGDKLTLTGNLGDVMKESAIIALQYLRSHAELLDIDYELFDKYNVHIHVPEGAIPKDGPSAGVTMVTSLASSFTQRRVRDHLAMTGEITLRGKVMPVGGIKEKLLAAKRAGITDVVLCEANRKDVDEIASQYLDGMRFHYVNTIAEVLEVALLDEKVENALTL